MKTASKFRLIACSSSDTFLPPESIIIPKVCEQKKQLFYYFNDTKKAKLYDNLIIKKRITCRFVANTKVTYVRLH